MQEVFKVLRLIESDSSRNSKKYILERYSENKDLKKFLLYAYSPRWIYGVGPKTIRKRAENKTPPVQQGVTQRTLFGTTTGRISCGYTNIFDLCDELIQHPYGSDKDKTEINTFLANCNEEEFYWYSKLLRKDLKIGCSEKTINEVYTDLIPEFEVMLAFPIANHFHKIEKKGPFQIQRKYNGFRFIAYHHSDGTLQFFTRNGVELFDFPEIASSFKNYVIPECTTMVYDGEITTIDDKLNTVQSLALSDGPKYGATYQIWDCLTLDEFERKESFDTQFPRYDFLWKKLFYVNSVSTPVNIHVCEELYRGDDIEQIDKWYEFAKSEKWEGVMVKFNVPYVRKRTDDMLKVKGKETADLQVIRVNKGEDDGQHHDCLGSVTVLYNGVEVNVGGGFKKKERIDFWKDPNLIMDKTIIVDFFEPTDNKAGTHSLQHPRFKGIRIDK